MPCTPILLIHTMSSCPDARSRLQQGQGQGKGGMVLCALLRHPVHIVTISSSHNHLLLL